MDIEKINYLYGIDFPNRKIVPGEGNPRSNILLIGEAPGREEEAQGRPFVGKAGKNLAEFLDLIKLKREDIFITNAVKFRPTKLSEYGSVSNRTPTENEVADYLPYLKLEIESVDPKIIVTLGNTPLRALVGNSIFVGKCHGKLQEYGSRKLYPLYHPASLIYNPALKGAYQEDVLKLRKLLDQYGIESREPEEIAEQLSW